MSATAAMKIGSGARTQFIDDLKQKGRAPRFWVSPDEN